MYSELPVVLEEPINVDVPSSLTPPPMENTDIRAKALPPATPASLVREEERDLSAEASSVRASPSMDSQQRLSSPEDLAVGVLLFCASVLV